MECPFLLTKYEIIFFNFTKIYIKTKRSIVNVGDTFWHDVGNTSIFIAIILHNFGETFEHFNIILHIL